MIEHIIYHILDKKQNGLGKIVSNPGCLAPNVSHQNFLDALTEAYRGKAGKGFGKFDDDTNSYPMPNLLNEYARTNNFYDLSNKMMKLLLSRINTQQLATGGTVFIIAYKEQSDNYILVAILSKRIAFSTEHWSIKESKMLDIEHLKFAGRINLTKWKKSQERYISFLKGKDEIAQYFKQFLSCNDFLLATTETKKLVSYIEDFLGDKKMDLEEKESFKTSARNYLYELSKYGKPFCLETFANQFWPENPQEFKNKLGDGDNGVADGFIPDQRPLKHLITYSEKTRHWSFSFDLSAIKNGEIGIEGDKICIYRPSIQLLKAFKG